MSSRSIRDGKGHRAYRRDQARLKRRTKDEHLPCGYMSPHGWGCGEQIDTELPATHAMSFTADHDEPLAGGGKLVGQILVPMHRRCNAMKGNNVPVEIWEAS